MPVYSRTKERYLPHNWNAYRLPPRVPPTFKKTLAMNGNSIQCSCLENLIDSGAWWAAAHGVARVEQDSV